MKMNRGKKKQRRKMHKNTRGERKRGISDNEEKKNGSRQKISIQSDENGWQQSQKQHTGGGTDADVKAIKDAITISRTFAINRPHAYIEYVVERIDKRVEV